MNDYRLKSISKTCAGTGLPLVPGEPCFSVLVERHGLQERLDFSEAGWKGLPDDAVGYWKCFVPAAPPQHAASADPELLMQQFEQWVDDPNPQQARLVYVLALYLLQRRRLKLDGSRLDGTAEYLIVSGARGEGPFEVLDHQLSEGEITAVREILDQQLTLQREAA